MARRYAGPIRRLLDAASTGTRIGLGHDYPTDPVRARDGRSRPDTTAAPSLSLAPCQTRINGQQRTGKVHLAGVTESAPATPRLVIRGHRPSGAKFHLRLPPLCNRAQKGTCACPPKNNKALFLRWCEVISQNRLDRVEEIIAPDEVDHALPPGIPSGLEEVKQVFTLLHTAFPICRLRSKT